MGRRKLAGQVAGVCNLSTQKAKAGGSGVQGHPWLHNEFEAIVSYKIAAETKAEHSCTSWNLNTQEAEAGGSSQVQGQSSLHSELLSPKTKQKPQILDLYKTDISSGRTECQLSGCFWQPRKPGVRPQRHERRASYFTVRIPGRLCHPWISVHRL